MGKSMAQTKGIIMVDYYKSQWHNCNKCRIHYMTEEPHLKAYLCDECWHSMPHYKVGSLQKTKYKQKYDKGYTWKEITLYTIGNLLCIMEIGYYLLFR